MDNMLVRIIGRKAMKEYEVFRSWNTLVGGHVAQNSVPIKVENGVLYVSVKNSVWRQELGMLRPQILKKIEEEFGKGIIRDIYLK